MNGAKKYHKPTGPAFNVGETWASLSGGLTCEIVSVRKYGNDKWDYDVTYRYPDGSECSKDAWNFQVRYGHVADARVARKHI